MRGPTLIIIVVCIVDSLSFTPKHISFSSASSSSTSPPTQQRSPFLEAENSTDALRSALQILQKRTSKGPDAMNSSDVSEFEDAADALLTEIETIKETLEQSNDQTNPPAPVDPRLRQAIIDMDASKVTELLKEGIEMDPIAANAAFWSVVNAVDRAEEEESPLSGDIPRMLHHVFEADMKYLLRREKITTNVTCMQPAGADGEAGAARRMNYIFDDSAHKHLPLTEGRCCEGGNCSDACSRNIFPTFASHKEVSLETFPEMASLTFNDLRRVSARTIIQFARLVERVRRTVAHEYGLPLSSILPLQAYSRKYVAGTTQKGGGGGEGDFVILHTDESTHSGYHYSCVLYLNSQGEEFEGGDFVFNDPIDKETNLFPEEEEEEDDDDDDDSAFSLADEIRRAGRKLIPFHPKKGAAVIFSSGWENMHEVEKITSGTRYAVPCFFTTCPVPEVAYEQMVAGKPKTDEDIADDWLHLLLAHRRESPMESAGRVKELLMKWHYMCTPLSEHV